MSLKSEILLDENRKGAPVTYKQGSVLYQITGLKWWQPETMPPPTVKQASILIGALMEYIKERKGSPAELVEAIQIWFPGFTDIKNIHFRGGHKKKAETDETTETKQNKPTTETPKPEKPKREPEPEPKPQPPKAPKTQKTAPEARGKGISDVEALIEAGIQNIWMVGPAGCGKTTICQIVGEKLGLPVTVIPCGAGTSATTFLGYKYPEREGTPFVHAFAQEGIIVLDEFTALEAQVAQIVNGALANNELSSTIGTYHRADGCIIIATSNTFGHGADRQYVSNNQLDASTIDRFAGGIIEIDYSREYESQYDPEVCRYIWSIRDIIKQNAIRKVASTRSLIAACKLKTAGLNWKESITANWSKDEKALIRI